MANSLLDFVMSLVRDPDAAARYAADPAGAIADAHLTDVSSADVNNLIPMVTDSLSMAAPTIGGVPGGGIGITHQRHHEIEQRVCHVTPFPLPPIVTAERRLMPRMLSADDLSVIGAEPTPPRRPLGGGPLGDHPA